MIKIFPDYYFETISNNSTSKIRTLFAGIFGLARWPYAIFGCIKNSYLTPNSNHIFNSFSINITHPRIKKSPPIGVIIPNHLAFDIAKI